MARQLALFYPQDESDVDAGGLLAPVELTSVPAADDVQLDLFGGPAHEQRLMEWALETLDAAALRAAHAEVTRRFPRWKPAAVWPTWADGLEWLSGSGSPGLPRLLADRALDLVADDTGLRLFPMAGVGLLSRVRIAAASRACAALLEREGPTARLRDGRAAGTLPLRAGDPQGAIEPLRRALQAHVDEGPTRAALAEALTAAGRADEALVVWRDALLRASADIHEGQLPAALGELLDAVEETELRGERIRWLPILADLCGLLPLPVHVETDPAFGPAGAFAVELCAFRRHRAGGGSREELLAHKRRMLDLAPGLREFVRRL